MKKKLVFVVLILIVYACDRNSYSGPTERDAYFISQEFIKRNLISPSTADFPFFNEIIVIFTGNNNYTVKAYVDSQNGYGAMIRSNYVCKVIYVGDDKWKLTSLEFK